VTRRLSAAVALVFLGAAVSGAADRQQAAAMARNLMKLQRHEEAAAAWETALAPGASNKELKEGLPLAGRCYEETKNYQKAITAYQRALQFDEKDVDRVLDLARVYVLTDLDREALSLYRHVLVLDKDRHDAVLALARLYLKTGQWEEARRAGAQYVGWEPRDPAGQRLMAQIEEGSGDLAAAGRRWDVIASQDPTPKGYFDLGRLWVRAGRWEQADAAFAKAEDLGFRTGALYLYRGVIRWLQNDPGQARALWKKALERYPGMGAAHFFLALAEREGGRVDASKAEAAKASAGAQGDVLKALVKDIGANDK
jgi:tetratricopeptide (TPR) repeat protein